MTAEVVPVGGAPEEGISGQYSTTLTSEVVGPTVSASQRLKVTYIQIDWAGTTPGEIVVYFGTGAFVRGTNKALFDGGGQPSSTHRGGFTSAKPDGWLGDADEELRVTTSDAIDPLSVTIWYQLIAA